MSDIGLIFHQFDDNVWFVVSVLKILLFVVTAVFVASGGCVVAVGGDAEFIASGEKKCRPDPDIARNNLTQLKRSGH